MSHTPRNDFERRSTKFDDLAIRYTIPDAGGAISDQRLVRIASDGEVEVATFNCTDCIGVNGHGRAVVDGDAAVQVAIGRAFVTADMAITPGQALKAAYLGRAIPMVTSDLAGTTLEDNVGLAFTNQPANDGVEVVSDNAGDTTQTVTIYYTRTGTGNTVATETKTLNGTTQVVFTHTDIDLVLAVEKSATTLGTVTFREASGNATIATLATSTLSSGKIAAAATSAYNQFPVVVANGATVKRIGLIGTDEQGSTLYDSVVLNGTATVTFNDTFKTVTFLLVGDVESTVTATVKVGAVDNSALLVGKALSAATAQGDRINALILPSAVTGPTYSTVRTGQEYQLGMGSAKAGATAGWVVNAAANLYEHTLPQSQSGSTLVIPISGLKVGSIITAFKIEAQIESAGGAVTLDADLRKLTNVAADPTDASVGSITQVSVTADTKSEATKTGLNDVVAADERFYILVTGTTAASTDIRFLGATVTVTEL